MQPPPPLVLPVEAAPSPEPPPRQPARGETAARPRRVQKKTSRSGCTIVALAVGFIVLMMGLGVAGILALAWRSNPQPSTTMGDFPEDNEETFEKMLAAAGNQPELNEQQIIQEVRPVLDSLGTSLLVVPANPSVVMRYFDLDRLCEEMGDQTVVPPRKTSARRQFIIGLRQGMGAAISRRGQLFQWTSSEIRNVKKLNNEECVAVVRHKQPNGTTLKLRWWLTRRTGSWKVYDYEDLDVGMRVSTTAASMAQLGAARLDEIGRAANALGEAGQALAANNIAAAEAQLKSMPRNLSPRLEALRLLLTGIIHLHHNRNQEGLESLDAAKRFHADMPIADYLRGLAFNRLQKWEEAMKCLNEYRALLGDDDDVCRELGDALRGLGRFKEAAIEYRKSLDFDPQDADAFAGFLRVLGQGDKMDDVGPRFVKLNDWREHFDVFAADCEQRVFPELLHQLVLTMRNLDPSYPPVDFYGALVEARLRRPPEAVRLIREALRKQPDENQRKEYSRRFLTVMAACGHYKEAYPVVVDAHEAFRVLAAETLKMYRLDDLKALLALHRTKHADDPLLLLYQAEIHLRERRYAEANRLFNEAAQKSVDPEALQSFRASRVTARYYDGQMTSAYREITPRDETFLQLANLCFSLADDAGLESLLTAHEKNQPSDPEVPRFRSRMKIRQQKIAEGVPLFRAALAKQKDQAKRTQMVDEFLTAMVEAEKPLEAYRAAPDAKQAFQILARQLKNQDRYGELSDLIKAHGKANVADPWIAFYLGELHLSKKEWQKAAESLGLAMIQGTKEQKQSFRTSYVYAMYKCGQALRAYRLAEPRESVFEQLARLMVSDKNGAALEDLVQAHRANTGDIAVVLYRESRAKLLQNQVKDAIDLFVQAYRKDELEYRRNYEVRDYLTAMMEAGQLMDGWRSVPDKSAALNAFADVLVNEKKDKELQALLDDLGKGRANDANVLSYRGELAMLRGQPKEAAKYFAEAFAKKDPSNVWRARNGMFRARIDLGEAAAVYREFPTEPELFGTLASFCKLKKDAKQLRELLAIHRKQKADDPGLIFWEMEACWLEKDYEGVLRLLTEHRDDVFALPRYEWLTDSRLVRCLVKLKRYPEAIQEAEKSAKRPFGDRFELVFAHVSAGDVPQSIEAIQKTTYRVYLLRRCYEDEELGPILRSEAFRSLREKFPEPKKVEFEERGVFDDDD
jgi:tetratricopeptide (TPR) repeat protein